MQKASLNLKPIGVIRSCFPAKFGTPRQSLLVPEAEGWIELYPWVQPQLSLEGLSHFSHLWVLSWFHLSGASFTKPKVHPPRKGGTSTGVFACRSPHRMNPIGLSVLKIQKVEPPRIYVEGLDLVDGTPVLDIKPYIASADSHPEAKGSWADQESEGLEVIFSPEAQALIEANSLMPPEKLRRLINNVLATDPRPLSYRGKGELQQPYGDTYGFFLHHWNVVFQVQGRTATVVRLEKGSSSRTQRV